MDLEQVSAVPEGYHMENHTTTSSQHDIEVGQIKLTERKETTTVTDDNQVNLGKTVIKHIRTIEEPIGMEQEETAPALGLLCCQKERHSQDSTYDSQLSLEGSEMPSSANQERAMEMVKPCSLVSETSSELLEPVFHVTQSITIYQRMILNDNGEEVEGERTVETDLNDSEVVKFLEKWNKLWHPKVSDDQVQNMIDSSLVNEDEKQEDESSYSELGFKNQQDSQGSIDSSQPGSKQDEEIPDDYLTVEKVKAGMEEVSTVTKKQDNTEEEFKNGHTNQETDKTGEMQKSTVDKTE